MSQRTTRTIIARRCAAGAIVAGAVAFASPGIAGASHVHSMQVGNGACVLLAADSGEPDVDLPFASPALVEANRAHPLHLLVHQGRPGTNNRIGVYGTPSDPCFVSGDYING